jgi:hypothetical protein
MSTTPSFASTPRISVGRPTTAETSLSAPTQAVLVFTAGAAGSRIHRIDITALATTTAGMVNLFWYDGSNYRLWKSIKVDAITVAAGTAPFQVSLVFPEGVPVPGTTGFTALFAATYTGDDFDVVAYGGDL